MPSIARSAMAPTAINTKKAAANRVVGFPRSPVTSFSRPCNDNELWVLYNFEAHARKCDQCRLPYEVYRSGGRLCHNGHTLAQDIAVFVYNKQDGKTYSTSDSELQPVVVEIPANYDEARSLLKAIERNLRHRTRKLESFDKGYYVAPRRGSDSGSRRERRISVKIEQEPRKSRRSSIPEIVDYPREQPRRTSVTVADNKKGSLYYADMKDQERRRRRYNLEVREPSPRDEYEHGTSGYWR